ncbi:MAG: hypothetical protein PHS31_09980, partial [Victivallaceae bacterium]|nr:hypothetical protein [Victivallaceae bacterium]
IRALKDDVSGALALLNWAESREDPYQRAIACVKYAEILIDLGEFERASGYLKNADEVIVKRATDENSGVAIGQGGEVTDSGGTWRNLRDYSDALKAEVESEEMKKKFGATYGNYVKLRRLQRLVKRCKTPRYLKEALRVADEIIEIDPASQFAAAAGYLKGEIFASRLKEESPKKEIREVKDYLNKFVRQQPDGLYRGEALMLLGKISLEIQWDAKDAEKYYTQALEYFRKAREKRDAVSLYAAINDDLKKQSTPTQKPTTLNQWKRTIYHDEDPLKLYNTANAPSWYISDKEKNCLFIAGMMKFSRGDFEGASKLWEQTKPLDQDVAAMDPRLPNVYTRLMSACNVKYMMFTADEKRNIRDSGFKLKIQYAEYTFLQEKFDEARKQFEKLLKVAKNDDIRAVLSIGIADCIELAAKDSYKKQSAKVYEQILGNDKLKKSDIYALAMYRYAMSLFGTVPGQKKAYDYCVKYAKEFPKGRNIRDVNFHTIRYLIQSNKKKEAKRQLVGFSKINDGYAMYLKELVNK